MSGTAIKQKKNTTYKILAVLCPLIYFASYLTRKDYGVVLEAVITAEGITKTQAGFVETLALISYGGGQVISGILGDKFKPQNIILCGLGSTMVCNLLMPFCPNMLMREIVWLVNGFAQSMLWPPLVRIMAATMNKDEYNDVCSNVNVAGNLGTVLLYITSSLIWLKYFTWKYTFFSSAIICGAILAAWVLGFRKINAEKPLFADKKQKSDKTNTSGGGITLKMLFSSGFLLIAVAIVAQGMLRDGITDWVPTFIKETFSIDSEHAILLSVAIPIFSVISLKLIGIINKKFVKDEVKGAGITFVVAAVCCLILTYGTFKLQNQWITLIVSALVVGCMHAINFFLICIVPAQFEKYGMVSTMSGIINSLTYVGSAAALVGFGAISDKFGWNACVISWCVIACIGIVLCFTAMKPWRRFKNAEAPRRIDWVKWD